MKLIIYLDVDGVLNCSKDWDRFEPITSAGTIVDPEKVQLVLKLQKEFDCDIVLSSTWRNYDDAKVALRKVGLSWIDTTRTGFGQRRRSDEILDHLENHPEITKFIILDDDTSPQAEPSLRDFQIVSSFSDGGFTQNHYEKARELIKNLLI